jgi:flagellin
VGVAGTVAITAGAGLATAGATQITTGTSSTVTLTAGAITTGTTFRVDIGGVGNRVEYISRANDTLNDVSRNLKSLIEAKGIAGISVTTTPVTDPTATNSVLNITNNSGATLSLASSSLTGGTPGGGLAGLAGINVETSDASAASALTAIEGLLTVAVNAAAALGSSQKRIENQGDFMNTLIDSITSGVGSLTDADMEAASARLQALQVQQQLGTQALSIANQGSQSLLALFR